MTNPKTPAPALLAWASRALGARPSIQDTSHPQDNSRVWRLSLPGDVRFYLKVSPRPLMYERETRACVRVVIDRVRTLLRRLQGPWTGCTGDSG